MRSNNHTSNPTEEDVTSISSSPPLFSTLPSTFPSFYSSATSEVPTTSLKPTRTPSFYPSLSPSQTPVPTPTPVLSTSPSTFPSFYPSASEVPTTSLKPTGTPSFYPSFSPSRIPVPTSTPVLSTPPSTFPSFYPSASEVPTASINSTGPPSFYPSFSPSQASPMPSETPPPSMNETITNPCPNGTNGSNGFLIAVGCLASIPLILYFCLSFHKEICKFLICRCRQNDRIDFCKKLPDRRDFAYATLVCSMSGFVLFSKLQDEFANADFNIFWVPIGFLFFQLWTVWKEYTKPLSTDDSPSEANNIFEDHSKNFYLSLHVGTAQVLLIILYVGEIFQKEHVDCNCKCSSDCVKRSQYIAYYCFALFIGLAYVLGTDKLAILRMSAKFWGRGFAQMQIDSAETPSSALWSRGKLEILYRFGYGTVIHSAGLTLIMMVLPIHVAVCDPQPDPTVFVLNVVAAFYIIELDDRVSSSNYRAGKDNKNTPRENDEESPVPGKQTLDTSEGYVQGTNAPEEAMLDNTPKEATQFKDLPIARKGTEITEDQSYLPNEDEDDLECISINS